MISLKDTEIKTMKNSFEKQSALVEKIAHLVAKKEIVESSDGVVVPGEVIIDQVWGSSVRVDGGVRNYEVALSDITVTVKSNDNIYTTDDDDQQLDDE